MAARKLQQEVDKCFKKVDEGVAEFEAIYEKIEQSNNASQKEKLEDNLKREIKKLQRLRDQIKTWAASNDIKDKAPLMEKRKLIETQMERFKAVEKAMKTKAYSKEGLSAAAKLDPKEQAKVEASDFLNNVVDELEQQIEALEAESESIQVTMKKGKSQTAKAERIAAIERIIERHKWHQGKLELIRRSLENGGVETDQVNDIEESIKYYVSEGMQDDFMDDDGLYDELNLQDEEETFGMPQDNDKDSRPTESVASAQSPAPVPAAIARKVDSGKALQQNGVANGVRPTEEKEEESIYHLPASLQDLVESFETTKKRPIQVNTPSHLRMLAASQASLNMMDNFDSEPRRTYRPEVPTPSVAGYPQEPLPIFDDPRLYGRIEPDTLFYVFYYKQGTYQQYLAAKALKDQSWRFHKQYQTWFQRHEEPKQITEEFEKGTYRFFDYESTWMNRRKAEFQFHYRFLEDDV
ncbi:putative ccr4-not transcription complex protein [Eutypa lata UCREL1]|uniref:Putative ccr4-not transcription complex protein n=1 Tax=Eutypa lata (strain UCR-EL1) TaxID=1287681 RepID=M7THV6_EUTLA|nr:putative ccr4-not transcription complex protein [Eutypa lata UCREL1]